MITTRSDVKYAYVVTPEVGTSWSRYCGNSIYIMHIYNMCIKLLRRGMTLYKIMVVDELYSKSIVFFRYSDFLHN